MLKRGTSTGSVQNESRKERYRQREVSSSYWDAGAPIQVNLALTGGK